MVVTVVATILTQAQKLASFAGPTFSVLLSQVNKKKYGRNWKNKERKKEATKKK